LRKNKNAFYLEKNKKMAKCISCNSRKGKRNCPALGGLICSQCCGAKKVKEIDCPKDCFYLEISKQYVVEREESRRISNFEREMNEVIGNENKYLNVLQNIEFAIFTQYKEKGDIADRDVETALEYLLEMGKAQMDLPSKFLTALPLNVRNIVESIDFIFEMREKITKQKEPLMDKLKCVYRVLDSVRTHYDPQNDCSYLDFIGLFLA